MPQSAPPWPHIAGPLDDVNEDFHGSYDTARSAAVEEAPILIFINDALIVHLRGKRRETPITPRLYHAMKSASHAPLSLYSALSLLGDKELDRKTERQLAALQKHSAASLHALESDIDHPEAREELRPLLQSTMTFIDSTLAEGRASRAALAAFADRCGPALLRLIDYATGVQLQALHTCVDALFAELSPAEQKALHVVVAGSHQARERSLAMQYFRKRLREPEHSEERVAYAENATDEAAALTLVGTRKFDRVLAGAFFGDERRMQRDLLGDAAAARLRDIKF